MTQYSQENLDNPLRNIDHGWDTAPLKYVSRINPDSLSGENPDSYEIEYVDISSVNNRGEITDTEEVSLEEAPSRAQRLVSSGDTIVSTVRTYLKAVAYVDDPPENMVASTGFAVLRSGDEIHPKFLWRCIQADPFIEWIVANSEGVSYPAIKPSKLGEMLVPLPPLEEQKRIVQYLEGYIGRIETLIDKQKNLIDLLEELEDSKITDIITAGIYPEPVFKSPNSKWYDRIPAHWEIKRLDHLRDPHTPIVYGIILPGPNQDEGVPIIKGGDCTPEKLHPDKLSKTTPEKASEYQRSCLNAGDLIYEIRGSIGRVVEVPEILEGANLTQDTARIAPQSGVDTDWLKFALRSEPFKQQMELNARGATVKGVNLYDLRRGLLPVPPYEEQKEISRLLSSEKEDIDELVDRLSQNIQTITEKRNAVIAQAVTGQINLSNWQQSDTQEISQ